MKLISCLLFLIYFFSTAFALASDSQGVFIDHAGESRKSVANIVRQDGQGLPTAPRLVFVPLEEGHVCLRYFYALWGGRSDEAAIVKTLVSSKASVEIALRDNRSCESATYVHLSGIETETATSLYQAFANQFILNQNRQDKYGRQVTECIKRGEFKGIDSLQISSSSDSDYYATLSGCKNENSQYFKIVINYIEMNIQVIPSSQLTELFDP